MTFNVLSSVLFFYFTNPANAAETVVLQYADRQVTVSLTELKTFVVTQHRVAQQVSSTALSSTDPNSGDSMAYHCVWAA